MQNFFYYSIFERIKIDGNVKNFRTGCTERFMQPPHISRLIFAYAEFKAAVAAGRKLRDLVFELSLADANEIASSESLLKKSRSSS